MSSSINSSLQNIDQEISQMLQDASSGNFSTKNLNNAENQIQSLLSQKDLPQDVRDSLHQALNALKGIDQQDAAHLGDLMTAKICVQYASARESS